MLTTSAAQTRSGFSPALISGVTRLVTVFAVALCWSVGYKNLGFLFLARSLRNVEGTLLADGRLSQSESRKRHVEVSPSGCLRLTLTGVRPDIGLRTRDFNC
ncbi:hypothetical protein Taro_005565 [Colocasia esculenta]|uniref:Uncharacterized protein n=1 Tax=Colocasia esculenta TaxID=4460 RepID=A0A843TNG5_COLES|nr:hypothetical protein [Colocasia esculenta]